jgi:hypothetical protein
MGGLQKKFLFYLANFASPAQWALFLVPLEKSKESFKI